MAIRHVVLLGAVGGAAVFVAGCDQAPAAAPTTVVVNTPPDGGPVVLLTVMVGAAFLALIAAGVFAWSWAHERRARRDAEQAQRQAEDAVLALTGKPLARVRLELLAHVPATDVAARPREYGPGDRRAIGVLPE
jgi:hypothetical protein